MSNSTEKPSESPQSEQKTAHTEPATGFGSFSAWVTHHKVILGAIVGGAVLVVLLIWYTAIFMTHTRNQLSGLSENVSDIKKEVTQNREELRELGKDVARIDGKISTLTNPANKTKQDISF